VPDSYFFHSVNNEVTQPVVKATRRRDQRLATPRRNSHSLAAGSW